MIAPSTAASRSASSKTMNGAFPPNSSESFLMVLALCFIKRLPTSVEHVNVNLRTSGLEASPPYNSVERPVNTLKTPAGIPARSAKAASAKAEKGVELAGLATMVQPAAKACPALRVIMAAGKFQGVRAAQTPIGSLITTNRRSFQGEGIVSP